MSAAIRSQEDGIAMRIVVSKIVPRVGSRADGRTCFLDAENRQLTRRVSVIALLALVMGCLLAACRVPPPSSPGRKTEEELPLLEVPRATEVPQIDGSADEAAWQHAARIVDLSLSAGPQGAHLEAVPTEVACIALPEHSTRSGTRRGRHGFPLRPSNMIRDSMTYKDHA